MDSKKRAELHAEVCMYEYHENSISVPISDLRELIAESYALSNVMRVRDRWEIEADSADHAEEISRALGTL